jgi:exodeoxyribonuclease V alpha subunit
MKKMTPNAGVLNGNDELNITAEISVTSFHPSPIGGGILIGRDKRGQLRWVVASGSVLAREPAKGETWRIIGPERVHLVYGLQIHARGAWPIEVSGKEIVRFLATNKRFRNIGWRLAKRLWDRLGTNLYDRIMECDYACLADLVGAERAVNIIENFRLVNEEIEIYQWLDRYGINPRAAGVAAEIWGKEAINKIRIDPYSLALWESWIILDQRALDLGVSPTDMRRLVAATEEALACRFKLGHTAATDAQIIAQLRSLLRLHAVPKASEIIAAAISTGRVVRHPDGLLQGQAVWWMEREVEREISERICRHVASPPVEEVENGIAAIESNKGYKLAAKQRNAIYMAVTSPLSVICGGAGTCKTTIVKAILVQAAGKA